jgi:mannose-6-phosphate isomerase-like protein (cupin superfamily)
MKASGLALLSLTLALSTGAGTAANAGNASQGFVLRHDTEVMRPAPGPHGGGGQTTGFHFFDDVPGVPFAFRKRSLHPGSAIGRHEQHEDEVYYVLSGRGRMTINGETFPVGPGDAVLTRPGSTHALSQEGEDDLVILIVYPTGP